MRTLTVAIVHDGENEQSSWELFNKILAPFLNHVECDVHIVSEAETDETWTSERRALDD